MCVGRAMDGKKEAGKDGVIACLRGVWNRAMMHNAQQRVTRVRARARVHACFGFSEK